MKINLKDALVFTKVVELNSFTKAGEALALPASAISRRVTRLEQSLGTRLIQRTTRRLELTDSGTLYFERVSRAMDELQAAEVAVHELQDTPRGTVRITTADGLANEVWQVAQTYLQRHPNVALELDITERFVDLVGSRMDLAVRAVRAGVLPDSSLVARKLASVHGQFFASPWYLANAPVLETLDDLSRHQCLITDPSAEGSSWTIYDGRKPNNIRVSSRVAITNLRLAVKAAVAGFGIVQAPRHIAEPLVADGKLQRVLAPMHSGEGAIWLMFAERGFKTAAVQGMSEHLLAALPARVGQPNCQNGLLNGVA